MPLCCLIAKLIIYFLELKIPLGPRNRLLKFIEDYNKENLKNNVEKENFEEKDFNNNLLTKFIIFIIHSLIIINQ